MTLDTPYHFSQWFTFEGRCFVCGSLLGNQHSTLHLDRHVREGYMTKDGETYTQVKEHPIGFQKSPYEK